MKRWTIVGVLLLCLLLAGVTACDALGDGEETTEQLVEVTRGDLTVSVSGNGNIESSNEARLSFGSGGRIAKIYVEEGDKVTTGDVLAKLDIDTLELAKTQAEVALNQAEVALTQAELGQETAEYNLKNTLDTKDALELALFNAQINTRTAEHHLGETRDIYTWPEIEIAEEEVKDAEAFLDYLLSIGPDQPKLDYAQARLDAAEAKLDAMTNSYDTEEVAIAKMQLEAAEKAEAQTQKNLDDLNEDVALMELQIDAAKASVEQARQSIKLARKSLEQAQKDLDEATIIAPIDGVVSSISVEEGDIIPSPAMSPRPVIQLVDLNTMELTVEVDEIDIPEVRTGEEVIIELDAFPDTEFFGFVTTVYPEPVLASGVVLYNVKIELDVPEDSGIKVGMSASADIILDKRSNVLLVPDRAVDEDEAGRTIVMVMIDEDQIEERPVVTGISDGFNTEIISGLSEGETVVETRVKR